MTDMMEILLNGAPVVLADDASLADAVATTGIAPPFAAAVNGQFVPRAAHAATTLASGDRIDLVQPVMGG
jgi:sulfur carrier protein